MKCQTEGYRVEWLVGPGQIQGCIHTDKWLANSSTKQNTSEQVASKKFPSGSNYI